VTYSASNWGGGGGFTASVTITNTGTTTVEGWTLAFAFPAGQRVTLPGWAATWAQASGSANVTAVNLDWNRSIAPSGSTQLGFNGTFPTTNTAATSFALNGSECATG
jgi:cellulase/cellobiase CelA1